MKITDKDALHLLKRANSPDLTDHVETYPEEERGDLSDMDIVLDEIQYLVDLYEDSGNVYFDSLDAAKIIMSETQNGKTPGPILISTFKFKYTRKEILEAKDIVDEYKRLKRIVKDYC